MRNISTCLFEIVLMALGLLLLAFVDYMVVDELILRISKKFSIPWNEFEIFFLFKKWLIWHLAFIPLAIGLFSLVGLAARSWRLALSGILLFCAGWEDLLYFLVQFRSLPAEVPWLDDVVLINWTRALTHSAHVTGSGLIFAACVNGIVALMIIFVRFKK